MLADQNSVIVEDALCSRCGVPSKEMHHRHFPEIRSVCGSIAEGAAHLHNQLLLHREGAQDPWHRETIDVAVAEVAAFRESLSEAALTSEAPCSCAPRPDIVIGSEPQGSSQIQ